VVFVTGLVADISCALDVLAAAGLDAGWQRKGRVSGFAPAAGSGDPLAGAISLAVVEGLGWHLPDDGWQLRKLPAGSGEGPLFRQAVDYLRQRLGAEACIAVVDAGCGWIPSFWQAAAAAAGAGAVFVALVAPPMETADELHAGHGLARDRAAMTWAAYYWRLMRVGGPGALIFDQHLARKFPRHSAARLVALLGLDQVVTVQDEAAPQQVDGAFAPGWQRQAGQLMRPLPRLALLVRRAIAASQVVHAPVQPFESVIAFFGDLHDQAPPVREPARVTVSGAGQAVDVAAAAGNQPFFILGSPRSGTTLLRNLLRQHPGLLAPEETHFFRWANPAGSDEYNNRYLRVPVLRHHRDIDGVPEETFRALVEEAGDRRELMEGYAALFGAAHNEAKSRWFDKSPQNVYGLPLIVASYPHARIVHIHRHPVDVAASAMAGRSLPKHTRIGAANVWLEPMQIIDTMRPVLKERLIELAYDDLVREPRSVLQELGAALGLKPFRFDTSVVNAEPVGPVPSRLMTPDDIAYVESRCAPYMASYGYRTRLAQRRAAAGP
jgi:hypothetical protein